jgi:hypothetical protein
MTLPSAFNPISLGQIQTEFGGSNPIALAGEYYRNGSYVTSNNTNVPTSGTIKFSDFYGSRRAIFGCTDSSASNYNRNATDNDGSCSYPPPPCVVQTVTTEYGFGFAGYLLFGNGSRLTGGFITRTNDAYLNAGGQPFTTAGGVVTTYADVGNYIVNYYTAYLGRYPDGDTFSLGSSWFYDFLNSPGYTSFSVLGNAINTAFYQPGGEWDQRVAKGGLIGNYDNCNNRKI